MTTSLRRPIVAVTFVLGVATAILIYSSIVVLTRPSGLGGSSVINPPGAQIDGTTTGAGAAQVPQPGAAQPEAMPALDHTTRVVPQSGAGSAATAADHDMQCPNNQPCDDNNKP